MRTTLDLDEDLILVARQLAAERGTTMGKVVSGLLRKALEPGEVPAARNGFRLLKPIPGAPKPSLELVNRLRDDS
jgi:hypothetical protein